MPGGEDKPLPPVGGPDELRHISDHVFPDEASGPEANAPDPSAMRQEFINILLRENPKCGAFRAEKIVDAILARQMEFYSAMAEAEIDTSDVEAAQCIQELNGVVGALIAQGAEVIAYMADGDKWRRTATRARACLLQLGSMMK